MTDEFFVIYIDGYIGSGTKSDVEYVTATGKVVQYLEGLLLQQVQYLQESTEMAGKQRSRT